MKMGLTQVDSIDSKAINQFESLTDHSSDRLVIDSNSWLTFVEQRNRRKNVSKSVYKLSLHGLREQLEHIKTWVFSLSRSWNEKTLKS